MNSSNNVNHRNASNSIDQKHNVMESSISQDSNSGTIGASSSIRTSGITGASDSINHIMDNWHFTVVDNCKPNEYNEICYMEYDKKTDRCFEIVDEKNNSDKSNVVPLKLTFSLEKKSISPISSKDDQNKYVGHD